jgi:predicted transcriptional regulator
MKTLKDNSGVKLTQRDVTILQFIHECGFCEMTHLDVRFGLKKSRNYRIIKRLLTAGLVVHERIFYKSHGVYRLSEKGAKLSDLPVVKRIALATYEHELTLAQLHLKLMSVYPDAHWVSERRLRYLQSLAGSKKRVHVADGVLVVGDKHIAIELELTLKNKYRFLRILKHYAANLEYEEVWYFCADSVYEKARLFAAKYVFIKVRRLKEMLE